MSKPSQTPMKELLSQRLYRDCAPKGVDCSAKGQGQSKKGSLVEALANILAGIIIAFVSQVIIFGHYGIHVSWATNIMMTAWFTVISLVRSFTLRRFFNYLTAHPIKLAPRRELTESESIAALWPR